MRNATPTRGRFSFKRNRLPSPSDYYAAQGLQLTGRGEWRNAVCPFHKDTHPSLRVRIDSGAFRCMVCGTHGGDVLAFHMQRHGLRFIEAAKSLGAWEGGR
jgi:DNA primase